MNEKLLKYLFDIKLAIEEIDSFFENEPRKFDNYKRNSLLKRAIERNLEIIGEALNRILKDEPDFPIENAKRIMPAKVPAFVLSRQVFPIRSRCTRAIGTTRFVRSFSTCRNKKIRRCGFLLSRQVSNLNSSDPESDVLPITPRDNLEGANI